MLLKRRTSQNIVWGGAAGCMPVLIGWAAVTGSLAWAPVVLFAVVFFWTPPHFWALAIRYREDYARAGVPMLPVVASPVQVAPPDRRLLLADGRSQPGALAAGHRLGIRRARRRGRRRAAGRGAPALCRDRRGEPGKPMRLFHFSNSYLAFVFVAVAVDTFLR